MNNDKTTWIFIAILVVAIAALIVLSSSPNTPQPSSTATTTAATTTQAAEIPAAPAKSGTGTGKTTPKPVVTAPKLSGIGPLSYLIGLKESLVCSIKTTNAYLERSGTAYVASGKLRANLSSYINGALTDTFMIDDGTHLYAWKSGATKGLVLLAASSASGSAIQNAGGIDLAAQVSYACNPWTENANVFVPPASVSFSNSL